MIHVGTPVETDDGFVRVIDGVRYSYDDPVAPAGPRGADVAAFLPFGVGDIDRDHLGKLLVSASEYVFVNELHSDIVEALNLNDTPLTTTFRRAERGEPEVPGGVRVGE